MAKLAVNVLLAVGMQAVAESIALISAADLDPEQFLKALASTGIMAPGFAQKLENVRRSDYPVAFSLDLMAKDLNLIFKEAVKHRVPMFVTAAAQQAYLAEQARGAGQGEDFSAVAGAHVATGPPGGVGAASTGMSR